tara:strand:+ start:938 stop:1690 length:753 start_codon:yes stop_codon:yes gene_type:complete
MVLERFERNLIELSKGDTWEEACKEWGFLYKRERANKDNHCICGFLIKNQYYYYNKNTKKIICCGMGCKKHIDDHRGNKKYDNNFISDLDSIMGNVSVGEYDVVEWCIYNEQKIYDRFFWRVDALMTEEQLFKFAEYLDEMWFELVDLNVIQDKIDEKLQAISDRKEAEAERIRKQEEMVRQQQEYRAIQLKLDRELMLKVKEAQQKKIIMTKKRRIKECEENIVRIKREIFFKDSELALEEALLLKYTS